MPKKAKIIEKDLFDEAKTAQERRKILKEKQSFEMNGRAIGSLSISEFAEFAQGGDGNHDPFILRNYGVKVPNHTLPRMEQRPQDIQFERGVMVRNKAFTAAQRKNFGSTKKGSIIWPKYWLNPYQYQDYIILQDIYANTLAGRIIDTIVYFTLAHGVSPKLEPKDKTKFKTDEELHKAIQKNEWVIDIFRQIDENISSSGEAQPFQKWQALDDNQYIPSHSEQESEKSPSYDSTLNSKWAAVATQALTFGRACMVPNIDEHNNAVTVNVNGKEEKYKNIPKIFQVIHPRDLGYNHVDPTTWKLRGIQLHNSNWILKPNQMIFLEWNSNNPVYGSMYYGYSCMQSMIGSARSLRRIIEVDFPLIAKTRWSGMYWVFFKRKGEGLVTSEQEHNAILRNIRLDGINISLEDNPTEDVRVEKIDLDPKINELIELCRFEIQYMMSQVNMPQGLQFGEQDLNRDTLKTGINAFLSGPIKKYVDWILRIITQQYYARMGATIAAQDEGVSEVLKEFNLIAEIEEFDLESKADLVQIQAQLEQFGAWTAEARGKQLKIENYESKLDPDAEPPEGGPMGGMGGMNITTPKGERYEVRDN